MTCCKAGIVVLTSVYRETLSASNSCLSSGRGCVIGKSVCTTSLGR